MTKALEVFGMNTWKDGNERGAGYKTGVWKNLCTCDEPETESRWRRNPSGVVPGGHRSELTFGESRTFSGVLNVCIFGNAFCDVRLGKTTVNWKQRTLRFLHLVLAIENTPVLTLCSAQLANGAQMEHTLQS
jgi:hypothetical protein